MQKIKYDLCLHVGQNEEANDWFIELKKGFDKAGVRVMAFSLDPEMGVEWRKKGMDDFIVLPEHKGPVDIDAAAEFSRKLGIFNFRSLYQTPQVFFDLSEKFCQQKMAKYVHAIQNLKNAPKATVYWTFGGDEFDHNCLRLLSRMHGGRTIYSQPTNMEGRMAIFENEDRYWKIPQDPIPEPEKRELQRLKNYLEDYKTTRTILWGDPSERDVKWDWDYPLKFLKRAGKSFRLRNIRPQSTNSFKARQFLSRVYNRHAAQTYYTSPGKYKNGRERFVYFPLHYPKDSQLTLRGKPFMNQAAIVEIVSRYVPYPYTLLVKEHPHARGWYKKADIKRMVSLPNVQLVHPFTNSHDLIPHAKCIVAINSSVGYEGILYRKPVIAMGRSFYRRQDITIDIDSLYELDQAFETADAFQLSEKDVLGFLWRIKYHSYPILHYKNMSIENRDHVVYAATDYLRRNNLLNCR